ncbi:uncharacterized protein LOC142237426 [Haematobia irritans]|uniref:uncharacterized protein LOC142237426 n=1 Tax=Haematobia irritans TaxID=7368 RepID=UPI003F4FDA01
MIRDLPKKTNARFVIRYSILKGSKVITFLDFNYNICDMMSHVASIPLLNEIMRIMYRDTNMPMTCPLKANTTYNVNRATVPVNLLPSYSPSGHFNFSILYHEKEVKFISLAVQGSVYKRKK